MSGLITGEDLIAAQANSAQAAVDQALALVTAYICPDLGSLEVRERSWSGRIVDEDRAPLIPAYGRHRIGAYTLGVWPMTALVSVRIAEEDVTADCDWDAFSIRLSRLTRGFPPAALLEVEYVTGWAADDLPPAIRQAVLLTAQAIQATAGGITGKRLRDVQVQYAASVALEGLPIAAQALLAPFALRGTG